MMLCLTQLIKDHIGGWIGADIILMIQEPLLRARSGRYHAGNELWHHIEVISQVVQLPVYANKRLIDLRTCPAPFSSGATAGIGNNLLDRHKSVSIDHHLCRRMPLI